MAVAMYVAWMALDQSVPGIDDANIFLRYGNNVVEGMGAVFNPGGERVEGYSSVLWMIVVTAAVAVAHQPEWLLLSVSVALASAALVYLWRFVDRGQRISWSGILLLAWVIGSPGFVIWNSLTLMDTALWTSLLTVTTVALLSHAPDAVLCVFVCLLPLARPEGMAWSVLFVLLAFLQTAAQQGLEPAWRRSCLLLLTFGGVMAALTAFRMLYFGYPLPNTYYAKVSPDLLYNLRWGAIYLMGFLLFNKHAVLAIASLFAGILLNTRWLLDRIARPGLSDQDEARLQYFLVSLVGLTGLLLPMLTGGDHFALFRFYQPIWPLLLLPVLSLIVLLRAEIEAAIPKCVRAGVAVVSAVTLLVFPHIDAGNQGQISKLWVDFELAAEGRELGRRLNAMFGEALPSIGVIAAGGVAYTYRGEVIDLMGLNNVAMGHSTGNRYGLKNHAAFNLDVLLDLKPDLIVHGWDALLQSWMCDEGFVASYRLVAISDGQDRILSYAHGRYVSVLVAGGYDVTPERAAKVCAAP